MADKPDGGLKAENKGGGYHGGPKRWTGKGPKPARHIPWPEVRLTSTDLESYAN